MGQPVVSVLSSVGCLICVPLTPTALIYFLLKIPFQKLSREAQCNKDLNEKQIISYE